MASTAKEFEDELAAIQGLLGDPQSTPEEVLSVRPSSALSQRVSELVEKSRTLGISHDEDVEWQRFLEVEHFVRRAKAQVAMRARV